MRLCSPFKATSARHSAKPLVIRASASTSGPSTAMRTCLITGGNTGIGYETALAMAQKNYHVCIACRDKTKGEAAKAKLQAAVPGAKIELVLMDLANLSTVRDFANRALDFGAPLDVLINNAGVMACPPMTTSDGFEYQLGVNHLSHYLLTSMLLPLMSDPQRPARIINVASSAHQFGTINFNDLMSTQNYQPWPVYGQSKLANVLFTYELNRRLAPDLNITTNCLHPGVVNTELARFLFDKDSIQWWQQPLIKLGSLLLKTPAQGAETSIYLGSSPEVEGVSGKYYVDCKPVTSNRESYDVEVARKLWEVSQELTNAPATLPQPTAVKA